MDTHHVERRCSAWREKRRKMREKYEKDSGGNPRTVRQLLGLRKETPAVLGFISTTLAGQKAQRQEEEMRK